MVAVRAELSRLKYTFKTLIIDDCSTRQLLCCSRHLSEVAVQIRERPFFWQLIEMSDYRERFIQGCIGGCTGRCPQYGIRNTEYGIHNTESTGCPHFKYKTSAWFQHIIKTSISS